MSESAEQQFNFEEELRTVEAKAKIEQGQQLAEQIQNMRETAQTKEDYKELQEKLVELRKIFEAETEDTGEWRNFEELIDMVYPGKSDVFLGNIKWERIQLSGKDSARDVVAIAREMDNESISNHGDFDETPEFLGKYFISHPDRIEGEVTGLGKLNLALNGRGVRSYLVGRTWFLEAGPVNEKKEDKSRELNNLMLQVLKSVGIDQSEWVWATTINNRYIRTGLPISQDGLDKICDFVPATKWDLREINNPDSFLGTGGSVGSLCNLVGGAEKKVIALNVDDRLYLKIVE